MKTFNKALNNYFLILILGWIIVQVGCLLENGPVVITGAILMLPGFCFYYIYYDIKYGKR